MKWTKSALITILMLFAILGSSSTFARPPRVHFGVIVGGPAYWPGYYYGTHDYYQPFSPIVTVPAPPLYVERRIPQAATVVDPGNWWYYCADAKAYYPYVKECRGAWQRIAPYPDPNLDTM